MSEQAILNDFNRKAAANGRKRAAQERRRAIALVILMVGAFILGLTLGVLTG